MAKYKVGDKVIVRKDLNDDTMYYLADRSDYWYATDAMVEYAGKVITIKEVKPRWYLAEGFDDKDDFWTDEMFEGLTEEKPVPKLKVGDKFVTLKANIQAKEKYIGMTFTVKNIDPTHPNGVAYGVKKEHGCQFYWFEDEVELVKETTPVPSAPITVNLNINIDNYANSCWHCRKGGIVDLYLNGKPGVCPTCGRVCNVIPKGEPKFAEIVSWDLPSPMPKENKPLTNKEIKALQNGSKVFVVRTKDGVEVLTDTFTCWRTVEHYGKSIKLNRKKGFCWEYECNKDGLSYHVYLEMPEGAVDSGK